MAAIEKALFQSISFVYLFILSRVLLFFLALLHSTFDWSVVCVIVVFPDHTYFFLKQKNYFFLKSI